MTGNFEVTIYRTAQLTDDGVTVHSKQAVKSFPDKDWDNFKALTQASLEDL